MKAIQIAKTGGRDVLSLRTLAIPKEVGEFQVLVRNEFAGVNFIDTYHRNGLYPVKLPFIPGVEGVGIVENVGQNVDKSLIGQRVAYYGSSSYAEYTCVNTNVICPVPQGVSPQDATAMIVQGLTAHYLLNDSFKVQPSSTCVIHAAGGGTGQLLVQLAKLKGARVIGTSSPSKQKLGEALGAEMVEYSKLVDYVTSTTNSGCDVVYDGVGKATFNSSLQCLKPRGTLVLFGNASGAVPPFDPLLLSKYGSLYLTRPKLNDFIETQEVFQSRLKEVFNLLCEGKLKTNITHTLSLEDAEYAHELLESGSTTGKILLDMSKKKNSL